MQKSIHPGEAVAQRAKRYAVRLCFPGNATSRSLPRSDQGRTQLPRAYRVAALFPENSNPPLRTSTI